VGPARPPHLATGIIGNVFKPFMNTFHVQLAPIFLGAQFPKRLAPGARPIQEQPPQAATLFVRRDRGSRVRDRIGQRSPSNQSLTSASQGSCRDLPGKRSGPRGSRIGHHRLVFSRHTRGHDRPTHPVNPETAGFRNPRQLSTLTDSCAELIL